jgi:hypothetical protein
LLPVSWWFLAWLILWPWRWRRHFPPKRQLTFNGLHGIISQKISLHSHCCGNLKSYILLSCLHAAFNSLNTGSRDVEPTCLKCCFVTERDRL